LLFYFSRSGGTIVVVTTPISMIVLRLQWSDTAEGEHGDDQYVVTAERNAVELASERVAGGACRSGDLSRARPRHARFSVSRLPRVHPVSVRTLAKL